jgi:hypothetical protein
MTNYLGPLVIAEGFSGRLAGFGHDNLRIAFRNPDCGGTRVP